MCKKRREEEYSTIQSGHISLSDNKTGPSAEEKDREILTEKENLLGRPETDSGAHQAQGLQQRRSQDEVQWEPRAGVDRRSGSEVSDRQNLGNGFRWSSSIALTSEMAGMI